MSISAHGTILLLARGVADRFGWEASLENTGIDLLETVHGTHRDAPELGDVVLKNPRTGEASVIPYRLPETEELFERDLLRAISGAELDNRVRVDRVKRRGPIEV